MSKLHISLPAILTSQYIGFTTGGGYHDDLPSNSSKDKNHQGIKIWLRKSSVPLQNFGLLLSFQQEKMKYRADRYTIHNLLIQ